VKLGFCELPVYQYPIIPVLLGHPHCPFFEEEHPVITKLNTTTSKTVILNSFCIDQDY
jgi:hypothetical protein